MVGFIYAWAAWSCLAATPGGNDEQRYEFTAVKMGVPFRVVFYTKDEATANRAVTSVWKKVDNLDKLLSDYDPDSELSRFCRFAPHSTLQPIPEPMWRVLRAGDEIARASDGAFDMTIGPATRLWRQSKRFKKLPTEERLHAALAAIGYQRLEVSATLPEARLTAPGMMLDLGGIAIGYTVDQILSLLRDQGITKALVDASGDIGVSDAPPGEAGWRIGLVAPGANTPPALFLILANGAVTTSGDMVRHVEIDGVKYSHIVDPHTGLGLTTRGMATVIAKTCLRADALTKPALVLGAEHGMKFIESQPDAACILQIVDETADKPRRYESSRVQQYTFVTEPGEH